jgi:hypothetical protein
LDWSQIYGTDLALTYKSLDDIFGKKYDLGSVAREWIPLRHSFGRLVKLAASLKGQQYLAAQFLYSSSHCITRHFNISWG